MRVTFIVIKVTYKPCTAEKFEIILDSDVLFDSLLKTVSYEFKLRSPRMKNPVTYDLVNPIINVCLKYALGNLDKYRKRAKAMLNFGIEHNLNIKKEDGFDDWHIYICNELGGLKKSDDKNYYNIAVIAESDTADEEIRSLIGQLPKFKKVI